MSFVSTSGSVEVNWPLFPLASMESPLKRSKVSVSEVAGDFPATM